MATKPRLPAALLGLGLGLGLGLVAAPLAAQDLPARPGEIEALERRIAELESRLGEPSAGDPMGVPVGAAADPEPDPDPDPDSDPDSDTDPALAPRPPLGLPDRPFLSDPWRSLHIGGYTELEFHSFENGILGVPEGFRMHRTNLFLFADLADGLRFGSEIEFETEFEGDDPSSEIDTVVEMAFLDWELAQGFALRGGVILPPLGRTNVDHDGPARDLTDRSLVATFVIPTTLSDAGIGAIGEIPLAEGIALDAEAYLVNGFDLLDADGALSVPLAERELLLRDSDGIGGDGNDSLAGTGRLAARIGSGLELGFSGHYGDYDERAENILAIVVADLEASIGRFGIEGEVASADFERDDFARTAGVPDRYWGYSVQGGIRFDGEELRPIVPRLFDGEGSSLTLVLRQDFVDLDGDRGGALEPGIALRPSPGTVFKLSWRFSQYELGDSSLPGREEWRDSGLVFSIATYF